ncbi:MAG: glycosyltransferase [Tannerellaceae bacterium]|jgi:glycosyltransferase involved in cell wall biosynthesis|nr:glycosyltransferase [Tannerellaceae bacterium]
MEDSGGVRILTGALMQQNTHVQVSTESGTLMRVPQAITSEIEATLWVGQNEVKREKSVSQAVELKAAKEVLVSVIVPNYNYARYLPMRIESILNQTFTNFELILLDDASTDESVSILEKYRDNEYVSHIVINEQNTGSPFQQWMKGLSLAQGKYVWIAEADDLAEPTFLEICVRSMQEKKNVSVCYTGSLLIDANGRISGKDINHWGKRKVKGTSCFDGILFVTHNLYWKNYIINASGALFLRKNALELSGSPFRNMLCCGDWLFWVEMAIKGKVVEIYKNLNYFRQHPAKVTVSSHKAGRGVMEDIQIVKYMENKLGGRLNKYKMRLRHGLLYRKIKRLPVNASQKEPIFRYLYDVMHAGVSEYRVERFNKYLKLLIPALITAKRDRLN